LRSVLKEIPKVYWEDIKWFLKNKGELYQKHEMMWVAVVNKKIVAYGSNPDKIRKTAAKKTGREPEKIVVEFIEKAEAIYYG